MNTAEHAPQEALRQFLSPGKKAAPTLPPELVACAMARIGQAPEPGEPAAVAGECVFLLAALLRSQRDPALATRLLQALGCAGRLGRTLAGLHIQSRSLPLPQFTPLLLALPGRDFLALLNDMLLDCPAEDKHFAAWLRTLLPTPGRLDNREALLFLKSLAEGGDTLARPLRDTLLAAGLDESLPRALSGTPGAATAEALLLAAEALAVPGINSETLAYALRTAGAEGPSRMQPLLAAPPNLEPRDAALVAEMRRLALLPEAATLLQGAAQTEPEMLGLVLANLLQNGEVFAAGALRLLPLLPRLGVQSCLAELPQNAHTALYERLLHSLAMLEPEFLRRAVRVLGPGLGLDEHAVQALATLLTARTGQEAAFPHSAAPWTSPPPPSIGPGAAKPKNARRGGTLAEAAHSSATPVMNQDFSHSALAGEIIEGVTFSGVDASRCRFTSVILRRVRLNASQMARCAFDDCGFQTCAFVGVDFSFSQFSGCRFDSCTFEFCDLSRVQLLGCTLTRCTFTESSLAGSRLGKTRMDATTLRACTVSGARAQECTLARLVLSRTDLSGSLWEKCVCRDSKFLACGFEAARIVGCECLDLHLTRLAGAGLTVLGGHTDNPDLAQAERATRTRCLESVCREITPLDPGLGTGAGAAFVRLCVDAFLRVDEARRTLAAMRAQDQRRRELALERLSEAQGQFLLLLPALLASNVFERAQDILEVPVCALSGHVRPGVLNREANVLLERYFPGQALPGPKALPAPELLLEAVYGIGSLGSVAQKPTSDMDCWVCLSPAEGVADVAKARAGLSRKLSALEAWAWQQFGLEVHFFPMDMADVRQNNFGMSDKESSGSAQAALLKEEFYRTALKLAGRDLLWWAAPPTASQAETEALFAELTRLAPRTAAELVDLGQPMPIPPGEYFGACLWQIVKALHSPYKSVMKLGLLEKYAGQGQDMRLLCDRIKEAVLRGRKLAEDVDPYLSLFTSIRKHYRQLADSASLALIGECLRLKADVAPEDLPAEFETADLSALRALPSQPDASGAEPETFTAALRLGTMVNQFMISAYRRIQEGIRASQGVAQISPEDLTRLGRRIAANFAQHPHKVSLVPFVSDDLTFTELYFYAEKAPGKRTVWAVKGKDKAAGKAAVESLAPIRRDTDVARLLSWLLFNGLYDPKQAVQAERSLAPIAVLDLQSLLADLAAFFPRRATLEPDLDEYLKPERVVRAYLIVNLPVATDKNKILSVSVLYATNWGEVFCQTFENPPLSLQKSPLLFLRDSLAKPIAQDTELRAFTPKKSVSPRLKFT